MWFIHHIWLQQIDKRSVAQNLHRKGLGIPCLCLQLQEISWATVAARHRYDCCCVYSKPAERKLGSGPALWGPWQTCDYSIWGVEQGVHWKISVLLSGLRCQNGSMFRALQWCPPLKSNLTNRFSSPPSCCNQVCRKSFGSNLFWSGLTWSLHNS